VRVEIETGLLPGQAVVQQKQVHTVSFDLGQRLGGSSGNLNRIAGPFQMPPLQQGDAAIIFQDQNRRLLSMNPTATATKRIASTLADAEVATVRKAAARICCLRCSS
jgi:hypothetical protein